MNSRTYLLIAAALVSTGSFALEIKSESLGGKTIKLSYPEGYVDLCSTDNDAASDFVSAIPPVNQLLGCYTTPSDYEEWKSRTGGVFSSHLITSVMRSTINANVTDAQFSAFKAQAKAGIDTLYASMAPEIKDQLDKATNSISNKYGVKIDMKHGQVVPLGIFSEGKNYFSSAWLASKEINVNGSSIKSKKVQISSTILSKGKVFVLFTYGEYSTPKDIEKYKNIANSWVSNFEKINL